MQITFDKNSADRRRLRRAEFLHSRHTLPRMNERYTDYNLRAEDERFRRAMRDTLIRNGFTHAQFLETLTWYRDNVRAGMEKSQLVESFNAFVTAKGWPDHMRDAAVSAYGAVRDQGPEAVMRATPSPQARICRLP
jgi:hypothetical protein